MVQLGPRTRQSPTDVPGGIAAQPPIVLRPGADDVQVPGVGAARDRHLVRDQEGYQVAGLAAGCRAGAAHLDVSAEAGEPVILAHIGASGAVNRRASGAAVAVSAPVAGPAVHPMWGHP